MMLTLGLVSCGCAKKTTSPSPDAANRPQPASIESIAGQPAVQSVAANPANVVPPPPVEPESAASEASTTPASEMTEPPIDAFNVLTEALFKFQGRNGRLPRDWNELLTSKFLVKMPPAPPGKRYVFDQSMNVRMANAK
jgi:hypothetical protein